MRFGIPPVTSQDLSQSEASRDPSIPIRQHLPDIWSDWVNRTAASTHGLLHDKLQHTDLCSEIDGETVDIACTSGFA
jgi:hypothetical protein